MTKRVKKGGTIHFAECFGFNPRQRGQCYTHICQSDFPIEISGQAQVGERDEGFASHGGKQGFPVRILVSLMEMRVE